MTTQHDQAKNYHFVGIGGIGMSGLARILLQRNASVSGSDLAESAVTESLKSSGVNLFYGHSAQHVASGSTVVYTTDVNQEHPELQAARSLQCQVLHRAELLALLMKGSTSLAVTGTHGKTTTSALLTWVLRSAGLDPSFAIGGLLKEDQPRNAGHGTGAHFVAEADESDGSFLRYHPEGAIVTNIDLDHMNHFGSEAALVNAFETFMRQVNLPHLLLWCGDDTRLAKLQMPGISYGFDAACGLKASDYRCDGWRSWVNVDWKGQRFEQIEIALTGRHNALNAIAVFGLAMQLGLDEAKVREGLRTFPGVARRCDRKGPHHSVLVIDDYAHHPTEVMATLSMIRQSVGPKRVIAVFQPHRYSRTADCLGTFGNIFDQADEVVITDIYSAREAVMPHISHTLIQAEIAAASSIPCRYVPRQQLFHELTAMARPYDVIVTLGAGDVTKLSGELADYFQNHAPKKLQVGAICGGVSTEHDVTLLSARQVFPRLNRELYDVVQFGITKQGQWISGDDVIDRLEKSTAALAPDTERLPAQILKQLSACDVIVPMLHGTYGEDGIVQGFFDVLGKAYVGCNHRAAALNMDKTVVKRLCQSYGICTAPFVDFNRSQWQQDRDALLADIEGRFPYPVWVKPTHLGSSIEVHRVESREALCQAIGLIFRVDTHAMVEPEVTGRELEVAVLGNDDPIAFPPGEVFTGQRTYDYVGKYSSGGTPTASLAEVSKAVAEDGMELSRKIYRLMGCTGLARVDFFLDAQDRYWLNEVNPLPGFTKNSLYPRMCEANGLSIDALFDQLILFARQQRRSLDRLKV